MADGGLRVERGGGKVGEDTAEGRMERKRSRRGEKFEGCQEFKGGERETEEETTALEVGWERGIKFKRMNER